MTSLGDTKKALNSIRAVLDADVSDCDMQSVKDKLLRLTSIMGLSAETMASAKKMLNEKEIEVFANGKTESMPASIAKKYLDAHCKEENALYEYADRLNAAIVHTIDGLRTVISLYKTELENSLKS